MRPKLISICFILIFSFVSFSQDSLPKNNFTPSLNLFFGFLPKTYPVAPKSNYAALSSVGIMWQFNGRDKWHQYYHYPKGGVELVFGSFNNPAELGYTMGFVPSLEINGKKPDKKWRAKFGLGLAYFNKPFDAVSNPNNYYIGSHFTNMTTLSFLWERKITRSLLFTYGVSSIHCSDGHTALPNVGMNVFVVHAGIRTGKAVQRNVYDPSPQKNKLSYAVKAGLGVHQFGATEKAVGGPRYASYHISAWVSKPFRNIHLIQAGFTVAYYRSFYSYITSQELNFNNARLNSCTGLLFVGHEFVFGKFSLSTQAGFYVYNPFFIKQKKLEGKWNIPSEKAEAFNTNRLGLIYYPLKKKNMLNNVKNQIMIGMFIKANLAQADLIEYSIGYVF